jgi:hypothetical protein
MNDGSQFSRAVAGCTQKQPATLRHHRTSLFGIASIEDSSPRFHRFFPTGISPITARLAWQVGTEEEKEPLGSDLEGLPHVDNKRSIYLRGFGASDHGDMQSPASWTRTVARGAEVEGFTWCYWELCSSLGAYDLAHNLGDSPLRHRTNAT